MDRININGGSSLIGIYWSHFSWRSLKKDISGQQHQIDSLINFTDALGKQTEALKESTKINSQILSKFTDHLAGSAEFSREQEEQYKLDIRSYFISEMSLSGCSEYTLKFLNDGGDVAILNSVSLIEDDYGLMVRASQNLPARIKKGAEVEIKLLRGSFQGNWNEVDCKIELKFTDKTERNQYKQIINFNKTRSKIGSVEVVE